MEDSQPDDRGVIQDFLRWYESQEAHTGCGGSGNDLNRKYLPYVKLERRLSKGKIKEILEALFDNQERQVPDAAFVRKNYLRPFAILLCIGSGRMISHFSQHKSLGDDKLPFHTKPLGFPSSTKCNLFESFSQKQWEFCAVKLEYNRICRLAADEIIPIIDKVDIGEGGSAFVYKVTVDGDYDDLVPPNDANSEFEDQPPNTYVLKTYRTPDAKEYFENEVDAFKKLRWKGEPHPNIIGFYGGFVRGETYNIILEYADLGNLDSYMERTRPPLRPKDKIVFFDRYFDVFNGLVRIHGEAESKASGPRNLLGWHQDVNPSNIFVKSRKGGVTYDCDFKIGDLGLSHFKKHVSPLRDAIDRDTFGTYAYGAPETSRSNSKIEQSNLQVKQVVDVWSTGCVTSEVVLWANQGWPMVLEYRRRRAEEMNKRTGIWEDCFHINGATLRTVNNIHQELMENPRPNDYITSMILDRLVLEMLVDSRLRPSAKRMYEASRSIVKEANVLLDEAFYASEIESLPMIMRRKTPPNLPPGHNRDDTLYQTPHLDRKLLVSDGLPIIDVKTRTKSSYPSMRSSRNDYSLYQNGLSNPSLLNRSRSETSPQLTPRGGSRVVSTQRPRDHAQRAQSLYIDLENSRLHADNREKIIGISRGHMTNPNSSHALTNSDKGDVSHPTTIEEPPNLLDTRLSAPSIPEYPLLYEGTSAQTPSASRETQNRKPPPAMTVKSGLEVKRAREQGMLRRFPHEGLFGSLKNRDHIFLIDNSDSMIEHRPQLKEVLELISYMVEPFDPDGLDLYFTTCSRKLRPKNNHKMLQELDNNPARGTPDMREMFANILEDYQSEFGKKSTWNSIWHPARKHPRKLSLYVLTNGVWQPGTTLVREIETLVELLLHHKLTNKQIGIQFVRFGHDPTGITRLKKLDSGLGLKLDVVDSTFANGNVWKMLLGTLNDWYDRDGEDEDESDTTTLGKGPAS